MKPVILASKQFEGNEFPSEGIRRLMEYGRDATFGEAFHVFDSVINHRSNNHHSVRSAVSAIMSWLYANTDEPSMLNTLLLTDNEAVHQSSVNIYQEDAAYNVFRIASKVADADSSILHPEKIRRVYKEMDTNQYGQFLFISFDISSITATRTLVDSSIYKLIIIANGITHCIEFAYKAGVDVYMAFGSSIVSLNSVRSCGVYTVAMNYVEWNHTLIREELPKTTAEVVSKKDSTSAYDKFIARLSHEIEDQKFISFFKKYLPETILNWIENSPTHKKEFFIAGGFLRDAMHAFFTGEEFHHNGIDIFYKGTQFAPKNIYNTSDTSFFKIDGDIEKKSIQEFISTFDFTANMIAFDGHRIIFPTGIRDGVINSIVSKVLLASPNHKFFLKQVPPNERIEVLQRSGYTLPHAEYCKYIATLNQISSSIKLV